MDSTNVRYARLRELLPAYHMNVISPEVGAVRDLFCAVGADRHHRAEQRVDAPIADAERWRAATEAILAAMKAVDEQRRQAERHRHAPRGTRLRRIAWRIRHARRNRRLRAEHPATMARLRDEVLAAYRTYRDRAADLTDHVGADNERGKRERLEEDERERRERATVMTGAATGTPVWAYRISEYTWGRVFEIDLQTPTTRRLRTDLTRTGLTPAQINTALAEERAEHPHTSAHWSLEARLALTEWHGGDDPFDAWQRLSGEPIEPLPPGAGDGRRSGPRYHGPSSDYGSGGHHFGMPF
ncbi:hypothetical protein [Actinoallomurus vinaceus]